MRILVTGAANPFGAAVCQALAQAGHEVRAFGVPAGADPFHGAGNIATFPGNVAIGGSVEPVASECQVVVHCANLDAAGEDHAADVERIATGTLYTRYGAERELAAQFIAFFPAEPPRGLGKALKLAEAHVLATRTSVPRFILHISSPEEAARQALATLTRLPAALTP